MTQRLVIAALGAAFVAASANAAVLWDQSALNWPGNAYPNSISGAPPFGSTSYTVCDVTVGGGGWTVDSVSMYFGRILSNWDIDVTQGRLNVFAKTGGMPGATDIPSTGALVPMTAVSFFDDTVQQAYYKVTAAGLNLNLAPGEYWIGITPVAPGGFFGPELGLAAASTVGDYSPYWSPFTDFGLPPAETWTNYSGNQDAAIQITGVPSPAGLSLLGLAGLAAARRRR
jgi:MYXO-CTERM domain-containing protein